MAKALDADPVLTSLMTGSTTTLTTAPMLAAMDRAENERVIRALKGVRRRSPLPGPRRRVNADYAAHRRATSLAVQMHPPPLPQIVAAGAERQHACHEPRVIRTSQPDTPGGRGQTKPGGERDPSCSPIHESSRRGAI